MVQMRKWQTKLGHILVTMECPFFDEFLISQEGGCLSRDLPCHALFHYYGMAAAQYTRAKLNLVDESELSQIFNVQRAQDIFRSIANMHGVTCDSMVRFWPQVERQRRAMGGDEVLPEIFKFKHWSN